MFHVLFFFLTKKRPRKVNERYDIFLMSDEILENTLDTSYTTNVKMGRKKKFQRD